MTDPRTLSPRALATRDTILRAARDCFAERGLAATTTREIARRAGVTQPLLHHYFGSKDALFDAVLEAAMSDYEEAQIEQWSRPMDDLRFFTRGLVVLFEWLGQHRDLMRLGAWARLEGRPLAPSASAVAVTQHVRARLQHLHDSGRLRPDVDVDIALLTMDAMFKGYWERREEMRAYGVELDVEDLDARFVTQSVRTMLLGLMVPDAAEAALQSWSRE